MRSSADQVQIFHAFSPVVEPEPCRLPEQRRYRKTGSVRAQVIVCKIFGGHEKITGNGVGQAWKDGLVQRRDDSFYQTRPLDGPVYVALQIRNRAQNIKAVTAVGRKTWVGCRGTVKVERKILRQGFMVKDVREQLAVAFTQPDGVVRHIGIGAGSAEIQDEQPH